MKEITSASLDKRNLLRETNVLDKTRHPIFASKHDGPVATAYKNKNESLNEGQDSRYLHPFDEQLIPFPEPEANRLSQRSPYRQQI